MRLFYLLLFVIYMGFNVLACNHKSGNNYSVDKESIIEMSAARAQAFNDGNSAGIAIYFTENGILMAPQMSVQTGKEAIERYYQDIFDTYETSLNSFYEDVQVSGDLAFGWGIAEVELVPKLVEIQFLQHQNI